MTTIFRKELKDILRWTPLGMIIIGLLCWQQIPRNYQDAPIHRAGRELSGDAKTRSCLQRTG